MALLLDAARNTKSLLQQAIGILTSAILDNTSTFVSMISFSFPTSYIGIFYRLQPCIASKASHLEDNFINCQESNLFLDESESVE